MKSLVILQIVLLPLVTTLSVEVGNCQTYQLINPVDGPSIYIFDQGNQPGGNQGSFPGSLFSFTGGTVSNTVVIDPMAQTIRQYGTVSFSTLTPATATFADNQTQQTITGFPNPPSTNFLFLTGQLTLTVSSAGNGVFDTGARPMTWNGLQYSFNGNTGISIPLDVVYSLVTGGQTYTDLVHTSLGLVINLGSLIDSANYPSSITLEPAPIVLNPTGGVPAGIASFDAQNGFHSNIQIAPEPSSLELCGLMATAMIYRLRRPKTKALSQSARRAANP